MFKTDKWTSGDFPSRKPIKIEHDPSWIKKPCMNPEHDFPSMIYIPPGESFTHTCPGCGNKITAQNSIVYC